MSQRSSVRPKADPYGWKIRSESRIWNDKKLTSEEGFILECPFGHLLSVKARPVGTTKAAEFIHCQECAPVENDEHPKWNLPPELE